MRIYISGPMEGIEKYEENFAEAEKKLLGIGARVTNPAKIITTGMEREKILKLDLEFLGECDGIYMLKGWQQSRGANREYGFALGRGMAILHEDVLE